MSIPHTLPLIVIHTFPQGLDTVLCPHAWYTLGSWIHIYVSNKQKIGQIRMLWLHQMKLPYRFCPLLG